MSGFEFETVWDLLMWLLFLWNAGRIRVTIVEVKFWRRKSRLEFGESFKMASSWKSKLFRYQASRYVEK